MARPAMIISLICEILACGAMGAGLGLPNWLISNADLTALVGYTAAGIWQACYTTSNTFSCVVTSATNTTFIAAKALATAGPCITFLAMILIVVYLCQNRACGKPRRFLTIILIIQIFGAGAGAAGCGVYLAYYLNSNWSMSYAAYIYFAGLGLAMIALVLTLIEICLQPSEPDEDSPEGGGGGGGGGGVPFQPVQREDSDVSVIIHQPYANPYAAYQPPGFYVPGMNAISPYSMPPPAFAQQPQAYKKGTTASERTADWANQVANHYQQYYANYYGNYYNSQQQQTAARGSQVPVPIGQQQSVGPSGIQPQPPVRTLFQQDDRDRGGIKVVQMGGT